MQISSFIPMGLLWFHSTAWPLPWQEAKNHKKITEKSVEKTLFLADVTASASKGENAGGKRKKCKILLDFSGSPG